MNHLGYFTDSFFLEKDKEIIPQKEYTLVRSPNQPHFFYGNYLLLNHPISHFEKTSIEERFRYHFNHPSIKHYTFCWTGPDTSGLGLFLEDGYVLEEITVLAIKENQYEMPGCLNERITIRAFGSDKDWQEWMDLEMEERDEAFEENGYREFIKGRIAIYKGLNEKDMGNNYGAYLDNQLVASAGLYHQSGIGRFQNVRTRKEYRNRSICNTLMHHICQLAFQELHQLVIAAEKGYHALDIYRKLGFQEVGHQTSVFKKDNDGVL